MDGLLVHHRVTPCVFVTFSYSSMSDWFLFYFQDINPKHSLEELVHRLYPYDLILGDEGQKVVQDALKVKIRSFHLFLLPTCSIKY